MDIFQPFVKHIFYPLFAFKDGEQHFKILNELKKSQFLSLEELEIYQNDLLSKLMKHAYDTVPFYRNRFADMNIDPHSSNVNDYFYKMPLLTKEDIQSNLDQLTSTKYKKMDLVPNKTGGSTGKPLRYFHNKERMDSMRAAELRHNRWAGWDVGDKLAVIWGARHDLKPMESIKAQIRNLLVDRCIALDTSSITDEKMLKFTEEIIKFNPRGILAYANSIYEYAQFIRAKGIEGIRPQSIITSAEVLHDHERKLVEEVFRCKVFNRYGCREVSVIASECKEHNGLHTTSDCLKVEIVKKNGELAKNGEMGNVVITDLFNYGMPFIRYKIEDVGTSTDRTCPCGVTLPMIEGIAGRVTDFLLTPDGVKVSGASVTIYLIANTPGVRQAQFVQSKVNEITLNLVKGPDFSDKSVDFLNSKFPEFFGNNVRVKLKYVENIPKEPSGKYRFSICELNSESWVV